LRHRASFEITPERHELLANATMVIRRIRPFMIPTRVRNGNPLGRPSPQHIELMPKGENFGLQGCARPEQSAYGVPDQLEEIAHRRDYRPIRMRSTAVLGLRQVHPAHEVTVADPFLISWETI
jgi:hypothetical protein